jgi:hypothetical protein
MNDIAELVRAAVADRELRGVTAENALYRNVTDELIDADRRVRRGEGYHGFPCWDLYRCAIAHDYTTRQDLRCWVVAFAFAFAEDGAIRSDARDPDLITMAAWDALHFVLYKRWVLTVRQAAPGHGYKQTIYGRFRKAITARLLTALDNYTNELQYQLRKVRRLNNRGKWNSSGIIVPSNENASAIVERGGITCIADHYGITYPARVTDKP